MEDGTIGTWLWLLNSKFNQIDKLIDALKNNPQDRRMMINLWQIPYLDDDSISLLFPYNVGCNRW